MQIKAARREPPNKARNPYAATFCYSVSACYHAMPNNRRPRSETRPLPNGAAGDALETASMANPSVTVRSESGDPVQLSDLRPVACEPLARIGGRNDGGYVVPLDAVTAAKALLSFGLSHDWPFERDFKRRNAGAIVHCYDHTVGFLTALAYSAGQLLRAIVRLDAGHLRKAFTWADYLLFFRADRIHFKQRLWRDRDGISVTIDDAFGRLPRGTPTKGTPTFVKMDIEGHEPQALEGFSRLIGRHHPVLLVEFNPRCLVDLQRQDPLAFLKQIFAFYPRVRVTSAFEDDETLDSAEKVMAYWERRNREITATRVLPDRMLHFDLVTLK